MCLSQRVAGIGKKILNRVPKSHPGQIQAMSGTAKVCTKADRIKQAAFEDGLTGSDLRACSRCERNFDNEWKKSNGGDICPVVVYVTIVALCMAVTVFNISASFKEGNSSHPVARKAIKRPLVCP